MNERSIVVMGGSFNPPTKAHLLLMKAALEAVQAEKGFFVPVSFAYLKRKMVKAGQSHLCLSDALRLQMLEAMRAADDRIQIHTGEMSEAFAITSITMEYFQEEYPQAKIYFVAGADKLDLLEEFQRKWGFLDRYGVILFSRNGGKLMDEIGARERLRGYLDSIVCVTPPEEAAGISSTKVREHLFAIREVEDMLVPAVIPFLEDLREEDFPEEILGFQGDYAFLSNDDPCGLLWEGLLYPNVTSAFLASKFSTQKEREWIAKMSPEKAKQKYSAIPGSAEWESQKLSIMEGILREKFRQHPELKEGLLSTGKRKLLNLSKKNVFWGINPITWKGENRLGCLLMKLRDGEWDS